MSSLEFLKTHRRNLHRIPELLFELPKTHAYLKAALRAMDIRCETVLEHGLAAYLDAGKPDTTAFRSDMDALPIAEKTRHAFGSLHENAMHACGHDGHMAMLLGLAAWASKNRDALSSNLLFLFQPAEESGGGARFITQSGVLERYGVRRIFALHVAPELELGVIASRPGPFMAKTSEVSVAVHGKATHAAMAREGVDASRAAADYLLRLYAMEAAIPEGIYRLLQFGSFHSGVAPNILSEEARLRGTMRAFEPEIFGGMKDQLYAIARQIEAQYGARIEIDVNEGYPAVINDPALYGAARSALVGMPFLELPEPSMLGEDFSFYGAACPALMLKLGLGSGIALHASDFDFDESALCSGLEAMKRLASWAF